MKKAILAMTILWAFAASLQAREIGEPFALTLRGGGQIVLQKSENGFKFEYSNLKSADLGATGSNLDASEGGENSKNASAKPILFAFFTTWCPPCRAQIPLFNDLAERYAGRLRVVGVLLEEKSVSFMEKWIKMHKPRYEIALSGGADFAADLGDVVGTPYALLLSQDGEIAFKHLGAADKDALEAKIKELVE